jgi:hypothetical protein
VRFPVDQCNTVDEGSYEAHQVPSEQVSKRDLDLDATGVCTFSGELGSSAQVPWLPISLSTSDSKVHDMGNMNKTIPSTLGRE